MRKEIFCRIGLRKKQFFVGSGFGVPPKIAGQKKVPTKKRASLITDRAWTMQKKEPPIFLKIQSKHRQVISSKFPKSFRDARDVVVFYVF